MKKYTLVKKEISVNMFSRSVCFNVVLCKIDHCIKFRFIFCMFFFFLVIKTLLVLNISIYINFTKTLKNIMMCEVNLKRDD